MPHWYKVARLRYPVCVCVCLNACVMGQRVGGWVGACGLDVLSVSHVLRMLSHVTQALRLG